MAIVFQVIELTTGQAESHAVLRVDLEKPVGNGFECTVAALCFSDAQAHERCDALWREHNREVDPTAHRTH